jgi:hypothetical protein
MALVLLTAPAFAEQATVAAPKAALVPAGAPTVIVDPSLFDPTRTPSRRPDAAPMPPIDQPAKPKQGLVNASASDGDR